MVICLRRMLWFNTTECIN